MPDFRIPEINLRSGESDVQGAHEQNRAAMDQNLAKMGKAFRLPSQFERNMLEGAFQFAWRWFSSLLTLYAGVVGGVLIGWIGLGVASLFLSDTTFWNASTGIRAIALGCWFVAGTAIALGGFLAFNSFRKLNLLAQLSVMVLGYFIGIWLIDGGGLFEFPFLAWILCDMAARATEFFFKHREQKEQSPES